jgi:hypothetical protein
MRLPFRHSDMQQSDGMGLSLPNNAQAGKRKTAPVGNLFANGSKPLEAPSSSLVFFGFYLQWISPLGFKLQALILKTQGSHRLPWPKSQRLADTIAKQLATLPYPKKLPPCVLYVH